MNKDFSTYCYFATIQITFQNKPEMKCSAEIINTSKIPYLLESTED